MSKPSDRVQGTLDLLLLQIAALQPLNGFAISQRLKRISGDNPPSQRRLALPGFAQTGTGGLDQCRMETQREQPPPSSMH
jgi:hypothetical protein